MSARDSTNRSIAEFNFESNAYVDSQQRSSVVIAQNDGSTAHVMVLSPVKTPRLISRITRDDLGQTSPEAPIAITCSTTWSETGLNPSYYYKYKVTEFTNVNARACDPASAAQPATGLTNHSSVGLPSGASAPVAVAARKAAPNYAEKQAMKRSAKTRKRLQTEGTAAPADPVPDRVVRWRSYIPAQYVPVFAPIGFTRPVYALGGDNTGAGDPNGPFRLRQTATVRIGPNYGVSYSEEIGESHGYHCNLILTDCDEVERGTASPDSLNYRVIESRYGYARVKFDASAGVPVLAFNSLSR